MTARSNQQNILFAYSCGHWLFKLLCTILASAQHKHHQYQQALHDTLGHGLYFCQANKENNLKYSGTPVKEQANSSTSSLKTAGKLKTSNLQRLATDPQKWPSNNKSSPALHLQSTTSTALASSSATQLHTLLARSSTKQSTRTSASTGTISPCPRPTSNLSSSSSAVPDAMVRIQPHLTSHPPPLKAC